MTTALVSVIIPVYNAEQYIEECIESILCQSYYNIEIIVCDDNSKDNSWSKLQKFKKDIRVKLLRNKTNINRAATRNKCIEQSKGDYILLQDADDVSEKNRIERLLEEFECGIDFVGSSCYCFDEGGRYDIITTKEMYPTKKSLLWGIPHVHASLLIKREAIISVGAYKVSRYTNRGEDYDMIMRLYAAGYRGKNIGELLYGYRVDKEAINRRDFKSRIFECFIRYEGFKQNHILFPFGWVYIFKPFPAHIFQQLKYMRRFK